MTEWEIMRQVADTEPQDLQEHNINNEGGQAVTLYEIDQEILSLITDDGEIADIECFESLNLAREQKVENIGCWVKNLSAEAKAIREEEKSLAGRRMVIENKAERLENYLAYILRGEKYNSPRLNVTYRKSEAVELDVSDEVFMGGNGWNGLCQSNPFREQESDQGRAESGHHRPSRSSDRTTEYAD